MRESLIDVAEPDEFGWQRVRGFICYLPSPEEIRQGCEAIHCHWSNEERSKRRARMPDEARVATRDRNRVETRMVKIDVA